jgi:hypothetical protein
MWRSGDLSQWRKLGHSRWRGFNHLGNPFTVDELWPSLPSAVRRTALPQDILMDKDKSNKGFLTYSPLCFYPGSQLLVDVIAISESILNCTPDQHIHARSSAGCSAGPDSCWPDMHITTNMRGGVNALRGSTSQPLHAPSCVRILDVSPAQGLDARAAIASRISGHMNARASPLSDADVRFACLHQH